MMNERIKELLIEAGFKIFGNKVVAADNGSSGDATSCSKKFANLIVLECVNKQLSVAANYGAVPEGYEPAFPEFVEGTIYGLIEGAELIKQHFGVEE